DCLTVPLRGVLAGLQELRRVGCAQQGHAAERTEPRLHAGGPLAAGGVADQEDVLVVPSHAAPHLVESTGALEVSQDGSVLGPSYLAGTVDVAVADAAGRDRAALHPRGGGRPRPALHRRGGGAHRAAVAWRAG